VPLALRAVGSLALLSDVVVELERFAHEQLS
jgi:hypothetical protein